MNELTL